MHKSVPLTEQVLRSTDCVVIVTDHSSVDYEFIVRHAHKVLDTRNVTRRIKHGREKVVGL